MISLANKLIYVAIPKTASTSINRAIRPWKGKPRVSFRDVPRHAGVQTMKEFLGEDTFNEFYKFTFVRNSWDIVLSRYHWDKMKRNRSGYPPMPTFEHWIQPTKPSDACKILEPNFHQLDWLRDENGDVRVDFIGRFETLKSDLDKVAKHLNVCEVELPHLNKTDHLQYNKAPEYTDFAINYVAERAKEDIEYFGYEF